MKYCTPALIESLSVLLSGCGDKRTLVVALMFLTVFTYGQDRWSVEQTQKKGKGFVDLRGDTRRNFKREFRKMAAPESKALFAEALREEKGDLKIAVQAFGHLAEDEKDVDVLKQFIVTQAKKKANDHDFMQICFVQIGYMSERDIKGASDLFHTFKSPSFWRKHGVSGNKTKDYLLKENRIVFDLLVGYAWSRSKDFPKDAKSVLAEISDPKEKKTMEWVINDCIEYYNGIIAQHQKREGKEEGNQ